MPLETSHPEYENSEFYVHMDFSFIPLSKTFSDNGVTVYKVYSIPFCM